MRDVTELARSPESYDQAMARLYDTIEARAGSATDDSRHYPYYGELLDGEQLLFGDDRKACTKEPVGFRQVMVLSPGLDRTNQLPFEEEGGNWGMVIGVLRGSEQHAPISRMVVSVIAMLHGESAGATHHVFEADFDQQRAGYFAAGASNKYNHRISDKSKKMSQIIGYWNDQIEGGIIHSQTSRSRPETIPKRRIGWASLRQLVSRDK